MNLHRRAQPLRVGRGSRAAGFTLVEMLVGLVIATLILGAASGVFVTTLKSWDRGSQTHRILQIAQSTGDLIERHLRSAVPPSSGSNVIFWGTDLSDGDHHGHQLVFLSSAPGRFPRRSQLTDMSEVEFYLDPAEGTGMSMRIDSTPDELPDEGGYRATLSPLIQSFEVIYFDGTEWVGDWSQSALPQAVEFRITIVDSQDISPQTGEPKTYQVSRLVSMPTVRPAPSPTPMGTPSP